MFRESLPIVVRNHIAELPFTKDTYKSVFKKADQVWDSNRASEPQNLRQVSAVQAAPAQSQQEVAAVQRSQGGQSQKNKNKGKGQNQSQVQGQSQNQSGKNKGQAQGQTQKKSLINDDGHCKIHAKWKENANFCAAPWGCKMKNVYKPPQ